MIEVSIMLHKKQELGSIRIENLEDSDDPELGNYSIQFGVDTGEGFAVYQRTVYAFPRQKLNVLALIRLALETLEEKELSLDSPPSDTSSSTSGHASSPSDLERRLDRVVQALFLGGLHHHRPALRRRQPEQPGSDEAREGVGEEDRQ